MNNEQDALQFLGFYGIFKESIKIILTWPKIFIQITLAFILPHSCLHLANNWITKLIFGKWATYWLIVVVYFLLTVILSLFSVSAIVYTVACIYSSKKITFKKVVSVVPKVWKRLMATLLCNFCILVAYIFALLLVVAIYAFTYYKLFYKPEDGLANLVKAIRIIGYIEGILFMIGFFYLAMIWQLANVVSVMEVNCGVKALIKSKELIKGKMGTSLAILLVMNFGATLIYIFIKELVGYGIVERIVVGILSLVVLTIFSLFALVAQTIFYLVCKSYHHESIDKSSLADQLDVYLLGEYVPLKSGGAIQLEEIHV
ncbi:HTH-type transcriptional regulator EstR [Bienertia sinuspersici]